MRGSGLSDTSVFTLGPGPLTFIRDRAAAALGALRRVARALS